MRKLLAALAGTRANDFRCVRRAAGGRWERWYLDVVHDHRWFRVDKPGGRPSPLARGEPLVEEHGP